MYHWEESRQENHIEIRALVTLEMNFHQKKRREFMRRRKRKRKMCKREFGKEEEMRKTDLFLEEKKNEDMSQARKET